MPRSERSRRRRTSRYLPPRPVIASGPAPAPGATAPAGAAPGVGSVRSTRDLSRTAHVAERETAYLAVELRRMLGVAGACLLLLAVLVAVDRLR